MLKIMSHNVWGMFGASIVKRVDNRSKLMWEIYSTYHPDIIGTQEFSEEIRNSGLLEDLHTCYEELDVVKDIKAYEMANHFTPVFYRKDVLAVLDSGFVLYDRQFNNRDSKGVTWGVFRHLPSGSIFSIANTHFWYRNGEEHDLARVENAKEVLKLANRLPKPFFLMGDLNCKMESAAYAELLSNGLCDVQLTAPETDLGKAHHPYPEYDYEKQMFFGAPTPVGDYTKSIDHMLVDTEHAKDLKKFMIMTEQNALDTSDHCPIMLEYDMGEARR